MRLARDGFAVYGLNYKDDPDDARRFLAEFGNPYRAIGADTTGRAAIEWGVYGVPETFVIDRAGRIRFQACRADHAARPGGQDPADPGRAGQMRWRALMIVLLVAAVAGPTAAVEPGEILDDPVLEARGAGHLQGCAAWCARTSRSTIPMPGSRATCACWCANGWSPATAIARRSPTSPRAMAISCCCAALQGRDLGALARPGGDLTGRRDRGGGIPQAAPLRIARGTAERGGAPPPGASAGWETETARRDLVGRAHRHGGRRDRFVC